VIAYLLSAVVGILVIGVIVSAIVVVARLVTRARGRKPEPFRTAASR
jgi:hypothetical protein